MWFGLVIIVIGVLLLLKTLGVPIAANLWGVFWALVLVAAGVTMVTHRKDWTCLWHYHQWYRRGYKKEELEELKRLYARGEISKEEFEKRKADLTENEGG